VPYNFILVEMLYTSEGIKTKGGIIIGFNLDTTYEGGAWDADLAEVCAMVYKVPSGLYYHTEDERGMPWDCDMDLQAGDIVWFSQFESKNSSEVECDGVVYKFIPYADCYVAKRKNNVICLNGYVLCEQVYREAINSLDTISKGELDMTRGIVRYLGKPNRAYIRDTYSDIKDLREGDLVQFAKGTPLFLLERRSWLALFDDDKLYWVVQRRRIALILKRE
jgi:hypothetical protein